MKAEDLAKALGGRKAGATWMARCPAHDDRTPSLSIGEGEGGTVLMHCFAGCHQRDVIAALRERGLWQTAGKTSAKWHKKPDPKVHKTPDADAVQRTALAMAIWEASLAPEGTPVETYLRSRGLDLPASPSLRFHPEAKHPSGAFWPAMVAMVTRGSDGTPMGIHRTFLARDGEGKAPVESEKMMLGPCCGGAVRLADPGDVLMVGEGIETCLAAMKATGHPAWAALSTSGLKALVLPPEIKSVIVLADGDEAGEAAAQKCAERWKRQGRLVRIARPPKGMDFNDMLLSRARSTKGGAP